MDFSPIGKSGVLSDALRLVESELPLVLSDEEQARLAVEVYKAWLSSDASGRIASAISELATSLEALGLSRNNS